jgi:glucose-6-phosphate isomerase
VLEEWREGRHAFVDLPDAANRDIFEWVERFEDSSVDRVVVLGIGGSSLGTRAIAEACGVAGLGVSESIDPGHVRELLATQDWERTAVLAVSKSGSTVETIAKLSRVYSHLCDEVGEETAHTQLSVVTGPDTPLRSFARERDMCVFDVPEGVGGRFSVLSPVGVAPLAAAGADVEALLAGAADVRDRWIDSLQHGESGELSDVTAAAADTFGLEWVGASELVMMSYVDRADGLVEWFRQLLAESLGKRDNRHGEEVRSGLTPINAQGPVDQHSQIQMYVEGELRRGIMFISEESPPHDEPLGPVGDIGSRFDYLEGRTFGELREAELRGTKQALQEANVPTAEWAFSRVNPTTVGAFMMTWELVTAVVGEMLDIDAFDQPGVERGKVLAKQRLREMSDA